MSQPPNSDGTTVYKSALEEYHAKAAAGYFKPATVDTIAGMSLANARAVNFPALQGPAPPALYQNTAPPPTDTTGPTVLAATAAPPGSYAPHGSFASATAAPSPGPTQATAAAPPTTVTAYSPYGTLPSTTTATAPAHATSAAPPMMVTTHSPYGTLPAIPTPRVTYSGHQPNLLPHHNTSTTNGAFPGYRQPLPQLQPRPDVFVPTPDSITFEHIAVRLQFLLEPNLTNWHPQQVVLLSTTLTNQIITLGKNRDLGPDGIGSLNDIFIAVGHEGEWHYMALAVVAPIAVKVLLRGPSYFLDGRNPLVDETSMEILRGGFRTVAGQEWRKADAAMRRGGRR